MPSTPCCGQGWHLDGSSRLGGAATVGLSQPGIDFWRFVAISVLS